jgi:hypothetical protein
MQCSPFRRFLNGAADGRVVMGGRDVHMRIVVQLVGELQAWKQQRRLIWPPSEWSTLSPGIRQWCHRFWNSPCLN